MAVDSTPQSTQSLFPEVPVRQPPWLRFLSWMEIVSGAVGLLTYALATGFNPTLLPKWHHLLAVAFFGANVIAGVLLVQQRPNGLAVSFIVQLMQVVFWNSGIAWVARAGLHITPVIASTGFGVFTGPATEFFSYPVETTSFSPGPALAYALRIGFFVKPLADATFACGVNLVALSFTLRLWRQLSLPSPAPAVSPRYDHPFARWSLPVTVAAVVLVGLLVVFGGPGSGTRPMARWPVSTGDTLAVLWAGVWYEAGIRLDKSVTAGRYYLVRFDSDFSDRARDRANSAAVARLVCRYADSVGVKSILVQPSQRAYGVLTTSLSYRFTVDTAAHCSAAAR
jgi:hypothetical protein